MTFEHTIPCGKTRRILSGGYRSEQTVRTWETMPHDGGASGDGWQLAMYNVTNTGKAVSGYAICGDLDVTYEYNPTDFASGTVPRFWTVDATCPADHHTAIGGGFYTGDPTYRPYIHLQDNGPQIQSTFNFWRVTFDVNEFTNDPAVEGWGVCAAST